MAELAAGLVIEVPEIDLDVDFDVDWEHEMNEHFDSHEFEREFEHPDPTPLVAPAPLGPLGKLAPLAPAPAPTPAPSARSADTKVTSDRPARSDPISSAHDHRRGVLPEFDREMGLTRRLLERVPDSQFDWRPHAKSMTLGQARRASGSTARVGRHDADPGRHRDGAIGSEPCDAGNTIRSARSLRSKRGEGALGVAADGRMPN